MTTTKNDLCIEVSARLGIRKYEAKAVLEGLLAAVTRILARGDSVELRGWGRLWPRTLAARGGVRNVRTGDACTLPRRTVVRFRAAKGFAGPLVDPRRGLDDAERQAKARQVADRLLAEAGRRARAA